MRAANVVMARRPWLSALPVIPIIAVLSGFPFILFSPRGAMIFIKQPAHILLLLIYIPMMLYGALKTVRMMRASEYVRQAAARGDEQLSAVCLPLAATTAHIVPIQARIFMQRRHLIVQYSLNGVGLLGCGYLAFLFFVGSPAWHWEVNIRYGSAFALFTLLSFSAIINALDLSYAKHHLPDMNM